MLVDRVTKSARWRFTDLMETWKGSKKEQIRISMNISLYLFKSILSIVVPSAAAPLIPEVDPKTLLTTAVGCDASTSNTRWFPVSMNKK